MADNKATSKAQEFKALSKKDQQRKIGDLILNNAMYIIIAIAIIFITVKQPKFISLSSIVNIISLTAAKLPIALGIGGCIVLTGTDISAGRVVGLAACISASLLTTVFKVFPNMTSAMPIPVVLLIVLGVGAAVGFVNGFSVAKFKLHPFIVTLSTQLITYGIILMYLMNGVNNGQTLSGLTDSYRSLITGTLFTIGGVAIPRYVLYAVILTAVMWVIWNKTKIGKNMFAIGGNPEAAAVCGVNIVKGSLVIYILAGILYGFAGALEAGRTGSATNALGADYALDAIAACVVGGVSMRGGIGTIKGIVTGVIMFQIINYGLIFIGVSPYVQYAVKGSIILIAVAIDTQKYLKKK